MDVDRELLRLWNIVSDITDQLNQNRAITARLHSHAGQLQEQAGQAVDGATLRRFNTDVSKEHFTSELERLSVALVMENQSLLHENKQLNSLMQEYEQTLETVMSKLRGHCQAAQTHQLTLSRHYEMLLTRERGDDPPATHGMDAAQLRSLLKIIRRTLRTMAGKDPLHEEQLDQEAEVRGELQERLRIEEEEEWKGMEDWSTEREAEIQRLERENAQLRSALGISMEQERELGLEDIEVPEQAPQWPPFADFISPTPRAASSRDDRGRGNGRLTIGPLNGVGPQRRSSASARRGFGGLAERVASPPNDIRWEPNDRELNDTRRESNDTRRESNDTRRELNGIRRDPNDPRREQNGVRWEPVVESI